MCCDLEKLFKYVKDSVPLIPVIRGIGKTELRIENGHHVGVCPFCSFRADVFTASDKLGIFHCFKCEKGGDVINFIALLKNLNQYDACLYLMKLALMGPEKGRDIIEEFIKIKP